MRSDTAANTLCIQQLFGLTLNYCVVLHLNILGIPYTFKTYNKNAILSTSDLLEGLNTLKLCATDVTPGSEKI